MGEDSVVVAGGKEYSLESIYLCNYIGVPQRGVDAWTAAFYGDDS